MEGLTVEGDIRKTKICIDFGTSNIRIGYLDENNNPQLFNFGSDLKPVYMFPNIVYKNELFGLEALKKVGIDFKHIRANYKNKLNNKIKRFQFFNKDEYNKLLELFLENLLKLIFIKSELSTYQKFEVIILIPNEWKDESLGKILLEKVFQSLQLKLDGKLESYSFVNDSEASIMYYINQQDEIIIYDNILVCDYGSEYLNLGYFEIENNCIKSKEMSSLSGVGGNHITEALRDNLYGKRFNNFDTFSQCDKQKKDMNEDIRIWCNNSVKESYPGFNFNVYSIRKLFKKREKLFSMIDIENLTKDIMIKCKNFISEFVKDKPIKNIFLIGGSSLFLPFLELITRLNNNLNVYKDIDKYKSNCLGGLLWKKDF